MGSEHIDQCEGRRAKGVYENNPRTYIAESYVIMLAEIWGEVTYHLWGSQSGNDQCVGRRAQGVDEDNHKLN